MYPISRDLFAEGCARADDWKRFLRVNPGAALSWVAAEYQRDRERADLEKRAYFDGLFARSISSEGRRNPPGAVNAQREGSGYPSVNQLPGS